MSILGRLGSVAVLATVGLLAGCAAHTSSATQDEAAASSRQVSADDSAFLSGILADGNVPLVRPSPMAAGHGGSRTARFIMTFAQGGIAHFITASNSLSSTASSGPTEGVVYGEIASENVQRIQNILHGAGIRTVTHEGQHGASSSRTVADVECGSSGFEAVRCSVKAVSNPKPVLSQSEMDFLNNLLVTAGVPEGDDANDGASGKREADLELVANINDADDVHVTGGTIFTGTVTPAIPESAFERVEHVMLKFGSLWQDDISVNAPAGQRSLGNQVSCWNVVIDGNGSSARCSINNAFDF
jgi:hypothetical protein